MLRIDDLTVQFVDRSHDFTAINGISLSVKQGTITGIVGESGAGKTTLVNSIMQILPQNTRTKGTIHYRDVKINKQVIRELRGQKISFITQNFHHSLSNYFKVKTQFDYFLKSNLNVSKRERYDLMYSSLKRLNFPDPSRVLNSYPFEMSGGMLQRIVIAMATTTEPELIIADEPTSAVDILIICEFLDYLKELNKEKKMTVLIISHDLSLIRGICNEISVLHRGNLIEQNRCSELFETPRHPYTRLLLDSKTKPDNTSVHKKKIRDDNGSPCSFYQFCPSPGSLCAERIAVLKDGDQFVKCNQCGIKT